MNHSAQNESRPKPGPNIIRAWFDTVINPLIETLRNEKVHLERGDLTWSHWFGNLDAIRMLPRHLEPPVLPNLEQVYLYDPSLAAIAERHDGLVNALVEKCHAMQNVLQFHSSELRALFDRAISPESLPLIGVESIRNLFGVDDKDQQLGYIVENIINRRGHISESYGYAPLWNTYSSAFLELLQTDQVSDFYRELASIVEELISIDRTLLVHLENTRRDLSLEFDVPIVTSKAA